MKKWERKQQKDAADLNGVETPRSGGLWGFKGDVKTDKYLLECKQTSKHSFSVSQELWRKIAKEAILSNRIPLLSIELQNGQELIVIDKDDFIELTEDGT